MRDGADERAELAELERARLRTLVAGDVEAARELHADDYQLIPPGGGALSREEYLDELASGRLRYVAWEPEAIDVRIRGDAACLRYRATITVALGGGAAEAVPVWHTDYYERDDGRWRVVRSHATRAAG
jgi:ketosteroid isomerase-like protein